MTLPVVFTANGPTGYNLTNSLRFRSSASAFLNRTPASAGNRKTWTWSSWVKRGTLGSQDDLFAAYVGSGTTDNQYFNLFFDSSNTLRVSGYSTSYLTTTQVFRDPSAWYHIMCVVDTTSATANNRIRLYVNGSEITAFSTRNNPTLNDDLGINQAVQHQIGQNLFGSYFDGYLDEVNFIDGQALTPTSFGSFNALTGVWQPARYTGTYGTNGFYLPFTDNSALTTSSNVGLGRDYSGNGNYWTTNNISITAGTTYDSMTDVPTLTSATTANYCVLNPLTTTTGTYSNANLRYLGASSWRRTNSTFAVSTGKWYWEVTIANAPFTPRGSTTSYNSFGFGLSTIFNDTTGSSTQTTAVILSDNGYFKNFSNAWTDGGTTFSTGDTLAVAVDLDANTFTFYRNNTQITTGTIGGTAGRELSPIILSYNGDYGIFDCNFGQRPFSYTPPTGFVALNTFNLPNSTIVAGNKQMDVNTYTGTGANQNIVNSGGMQPDLVWVKSRSTASRNTLFDSVRGITKVLWSDSTDAEGTANAGTGLTAFASNGFTLGTEIAGTSGSTNTNGVTYAAWCWKAGGAAVTNTAGSISAQVSANTTAGFSVVTYTGTGANATIGHGLGVAPKMIIVKNRVDGSTLWSVYHASVGAGSVAHLNSTAAFSASGDWNNTTPTSSVYSVNNSSRTNASGQGMVAYCFSEVAGYSKFGSYTGNGSTDGTFVYLGFRPAFVMTKISSGSGNWYMWDNKRIISANGDAGLLYADSSLAESDYNAAGIDLLSNGFKIRNSDNSDNGSGVTVIYMAFAENPQKLALAR